MIILLCIESIISFGAILRARAQGMVFQVHECISETLKRRGKGMKFTRRPRTREIIIPNCWGKEL